MDFPDYLSYLDDVSLQGFQLELPASPLQSQPPYLPSRLPALPLPTPLQSQPPYLPSRLPALPLPAPFQSHPPYLPPRLPASPLSFPASPLPFSSPYLTSTRPASPISYLQSPLLTSATAPLETVSNKMQDQTDFFMVANRRELTVPTDSHFCRQVILNALRTTVPSLSALKISNVTVDLMIYDFYFEGNTLRMLVIDLETMELFDAFALEQDLLHLLVSCTDIVDHKSPRTDWSAVSYSSGFDNYFIKCTLIDRFQSLGKGICAAAKKGRFSPSLQNWLATTTRSFFTIARVKEPPVGYVPLPKRFAESLFATAQLRGLQGGNCFDEHCLCKRVRAEYDYALSTGKRTSKLSVTELLRYLRSGVALNVKQFISPCVRSIKGVLPLPEAPVSTKCFLGKQCKTKLLCYWVECCKKNRPLTCMRHGKKYATKNKERMRCPLHKVESKMAILFNI
jgi:hypothetical protein